MYKTARRRHFVIESIDVENIIQGQYYLRFGILFVLLMQKLHFFMFYKFVLNISKHIMKNANSHSYEICF